MVSERNDNSARHLSTISKLLSSSSLLRDNADLRVVCSSAVGVVCKREDASDSSVSVPVAVQPKFHNALESLLDRVSSVSEVSMDSGLRRIFGGQLSGVGIVEVTGPSGSGKTSFCISFANFSPKPTLYIDTCGSLSLDRVRNPDKLIYLRVFNCEELEAVVSDFERLLLEDGFLPVTGRVRARSVGTLIIDSLWPFCLLDVGYITRYLCRLSVYLRHIAWHHNISVLVSNNSIKSGVRTSSSGRSGSSISWHDRWLSRCSMQISLEQGTFYGDNVESNTSSAISDPLDCYSRRLDGEGGSGFSFCVRRVMIISTGSEYYRRRIEFGIKDQSVVLYYT